jgi:hypothetical protein
MALDPGIILSGTAGRAPIEGPIDQYAKAIQLKSLLQAQQQQAALAPGQQQLQAQAVTAGQQEAKIRDQQIKDQQAQTAAMNEWDGKDPHALPGLILKHGGSSSAVMATGQQILEQQKAKSAMAKDDAETGAKNFDTAQKKNDALLGSLSTLNGVPDEQLHDATLGKIQEAAQSGLLDPAHAQQMAQNIGGIQDPKELRKQLGIVEKGLLGEKAQFDQAQKERETTASESKAQTEAERLDLEKQGLIGPAAGVDRRELNDWLARPENKGKDAADFAAFKAKLAPTATMAVQMAAGGGLTKDALDQQAENYFNTGKLPPARGAAGIAQNRQIMNRAAELHSGESLAAGSAEYAANKRSLGDLQKNLDTVTAFENTALKNIDQVTKIAKTIPDLGVKFANVPLRKITADMIGTDNMARLRTALASAQAESAKVLSSANASGVLSDSARHEAQEFLDGNLPLSAMLAQADQLHTDFGNRHQSYADQIAAIKNRLGDKKAVSEGAGPVNSSTSHVIQIGGKNYRYKGTGPTNDLKSYDPI